MLRNESTAPPAPRPGSLRPTSVTLSDGEFNRIRELVKRHTGISLSEAKRELVHGRLVRRLRALDIASFAEYAELLDREHSEELEQFTNAITTNLTGFFRESHHFDFLAGTALPELFESRASQRSLRIWSAGCSSGEEPYSIAMVVAEALAARAGWDVKILATDLDSNMVSRGASGVYAENRVETIDSARRNRWLQRGKGAHEGEARVRSELKELIRFRQLNLMEAWPLRRQMDILFCRNVVIYFDKDTQRKLFDRFAEQMAPDGFLFIGHSESLFNVTDRFESIGKTIYRRVR